MNPRRWALAALQAAVSVSWMTYAHFQPKLLERFGFTAIAGLLGWYLALAGSTLAPLAGHASDRLVQSGGDRFPLVRAGVGLAAASFLAVALVAGAAPDSPWRFVLPLFVGIWIAGMTLFQAPALALLRDDEPGTVSRPVAPVIAATMLPTALWPWIEPMLARMGGSMAFLAGGIAVTATAAGLGRTVAIAPHDGVEAKAGNDDPGRALVVSFVTGVASAATVLLAVDAIPQVLHEHRAWYTAVCGVVVALTAFASERFGLYPLGALIGGLILVIPVGMGWFIAPRSDGLVETGMLGLVVGNAVGLQLTTVVPAALGTSAHGAGLRAGIFLAGAAVGSRLVGMVAG
jgi:MFS family permease